MPELPKKADIPKPPCDICRSTEHITVNHQEILNSGVPVVAVEKLLPGIDTRGLYNENPDKYSKHQPYFRDSGGRSQYTAYSDILKNIFTTGKRSEFFELLKGKIVVDLGAGMHPYVYSVAVESEASGYIAVDLWHGQHLKDELDERVYGSGQTESFPRVNAEKRIPASFIDEDMLTFLRRLPDHSVSIAAFGLGDGIIKGQYAKEVNKEVQRVLHPNGILFTDGLSGSPVGMEGDHIYITEEGDIVEQGFPRSQDYLNVYMPKDTAGK